MANEIVPDEGLDYLLTLLLKGGTPPTTTYLGLFTSQTATTTPAGTAVLATSTGVAEAAFTSYARVAVATADWGAIAAKTIWAQSGARGTTAAQKSFPAAGGAYATAINGFFLATAATGGIALLYSNFDDTTAIASLALGDIVKITPTYGLLG